MNSILQEEEIDIHIRCWDSENYLVKTRFFDSQFMYHANQDNLHQSITRSIEGLPKTNITNFQWMALIKTGQCRKN